MKYVSVGLWALCCAFLMGGCADDPVESGTPDWVNASPQSDAVVAPPGPNDPGENCQFEPSLQGNQIGQQVKNFTLKDAYNKTYKLHASCGKKTEAIWVVLAAGW
jgi:hypothetical protein